MVNPDDIEFLDKEEKKLLAFAEQGIDTQLQDKNKRGVAEYTFIGVDDTKRRVIAELIRRYRAAKWVVTLELRTNTTDHGARGGSTTKSVDVQFRVAHPLIHHGKLDVESE